LSAHIFQVPEDEGIQKILDQLKEYNELNDKVEFLKNQNHDIDKYAERLQKELKTLKKTVGNFLHCKSGDDSWSDRFDNLKTLLK